jgi:hypothetical protein
MSGLPAWPSQNVLQYLPSLGMQLQLGCAHFFVSAMILDLLAVLDCAKAKVFRVFRLTRKPAGEIGLDELLHSLPPGQAQPQAAVFAFYMYVHIEEGTAESLTRHPFGD